jgi:hypothetical protein
MRFLEYLYNRCIAADEETQAQRVRSPGPIRRFLRWMAQPA